MTENVDAALGGAKKLLSHIFKLESRALFYKHGLGVHNNFSC